MRYVEETYTDSMVGNTVENLTQWKYLIYWNDGEIVKNRILLANRSNNIGNFTYMTEVMAHKILYKKICTQYFLQTGEFYYNFNFQFRMEKRKKVHLFFDIFYVNFIGMFSKGSEILTKPPLATLDSSSLPGWIGKGRAIY